LSSTHNTLSHFNCLLASTHQLLNSTSITRNLTTRQTKTTRAPCTSGRRLTKTGKRKSTWTHWRTRSAHSGTRTQSYRECYTTMLVSAQSSSRQTSPACSSNLSQAKTSLRRNTKLRGLPSISRKPNCSPSCEKWLSRVSVDLVEHLESVSLRRCPKRKRIQKPDCLKARS